MIIGRGERNILIFVALACLLSFYILISTGSAHRTSLKERNMEENEYRVAALRRQIVLQEHRNSLPDKSLYEEEKEVLRDGDTVIYHKHYTNEITDQRENATIMTLVKSTELYNLLPTIRNFEDRFNKNFHYDWVFINDEKFPENFQAQVKSVCSGSVTFIHLPESMWSYPEFIDQKAATIVRHQMQRQGIKYGGSVAYRHMCRFFSGLFYQLEELKKYKYYWRIEPDVEFRCSINYDPFKAMRLEDKVYGFTLAPLELHTTIPTLWKTTLEYIKKYSKRIAKDNNFMFLTDDGGKTFNMCHFWSNFEIGDLDFFRSDTYTHFFNYLDHKGGIYYERWGDAPIHTIAVSILLPHNKLKFFSNTGYFHSPNLQCDGSPEMITNNECICSSEEDSSWGDQSCIPKLYDIHSDWERPFYASKNKYIPIHDKRLRQLEQKRQELKKEGLSKEEIEKKLNEELQKAPTEEDAVNQEVEKVKKSKSNSLKKKKEERMKQMIKMKEEQKKKQQNMEKGGK